MRDGRGDGLVVCAVPVAAFDNAVVGFDRSWFVMLPRPARAFDGPGEGRSKRAQPPGRDEESDHDDGDEDQRQPQRQGYRGDSESKDEDRGNDRRGPSLPSCSANETKVTISERAPDVAGP